MRKLKTVRPGYREVVSMYFTDRNGVRHRRPNGKPYRFWVKCK
jgi:hypothetical protein